MGGSKLFNVFLIPILFDLHSSIFPSFLLYPSCTSRRERGEKAKSLLLTDQELQLILAHLICLGFLSMVKKKMMRCNLHTSDEEAKI